MVSQKCKLISRALLIATSSLSVFSWTSVTTISGTGSYDPNVSVNSTGEAVAVWSNQTETDVFTQAALFDGVYWEEFETISGAGNNFDPIAKIDGDGNIVAAWELFDSGERTIYTAQKPVGDPWTTPLAVSVADTVCSLSMATNASGQSIVGWVNKDSNTIEVVTQVFGGSWSSITPISTSGGNKGSLQVGIDSSGKGFASWEEFSSATISVTQTTEDINSSWETPIVISGVGVFTTPSLSVAPGGTALLSWIDYDTYNIFASIYDDGSWQSPETLTTEFCYWPKASALDDVLFVSWQNIGTGNNQLVRGTVSGWESPVDISLVNPNDIPVISAASSNSHSAWTDLTEGQILAINCAASGSPSTPVEISVGDLNLSPEIASSPALTVGVWMAINGVDTTIDANID